VTSVLFEDECPFWARSHAVAGYLGIFGSDLVLFEGGVADFVDREQIAINGIALCVSHAFRLLETNFHRISSIYPDPSIPKDAQDQT
jgi:hypothetical protein